MESRALVLVLFALLFSSSLGATYGPLDELRTRNTVLQSLWDPLKPHCQWDGVTCDADDEVIKIDVNFKKFPTDLDAGLSNFPRIETIFFKALGDVTFPADLADILTLRTLDFSFLTDAPALDTLPSLPLLTTFICSSCGVSRADQLCSLVPNVENVDLSINFIDRMGFFKDCLSLHHLDLTHNLVRSMETFPNISALESLNLDGNNISNVVNLPSSLQTLVLDGITLETIDFTQAFSLKTLTVTREVFKANVDATICVCRDLNSLCLSAATFIRLPSCIIQVCFRGLWVFCDGIEIFFK